MSRQSAPEGCHIPLNVQKKTKKKTTTTNKQKTLNQTKYTNMLSATSKIVFFHRTGILVERLLHSSNTSTYRGLTAEKSYDY